ncbi:MAG TPA: hypothetical protein VF095_09205 [Bacillota bacterium]
MSKSAQNLLRTIKNESLSPEEVSERAKIPLFKVRSSLRDMQSMGFVIEENGHFQMNPDAKKIVEKR